MDADFFDYRIGPDAKILMCSDGLSNMVDNVEIQRIIEKPVAAEQTVKALVAAANDNGGMDNIAVIIIEPDSDEEEQC